MSVPKVKCFLNSPTIKGQRYCILRKTLGRGSFSKVYLGYVCNCQLEYESVDDANLFQMELDTSSQDLNESECASKLVASGDKCVECKCDVDSAQQIAIKVMTITKKKSRKVLLNEISIVRELNHPNIVNFIDVIDEEKDTPVANVGSDSEDSDRSPRIYIVLEYCGGGDMKHYLGSNRRLKEKYAKYYFRQIAKGLRYLHSQSIVHRDLKPQNVLLSNDKKTLKIADFGFAKIIGSESLAETMCGSPLYMAPEIMKGRKYTSKSDLWSVGVMMYEALTGIHPFGGASSIYELIEKIERHSKRNTLRFPKGVILSSNSRDILRRLLKANPRERLEWDDFFGHPFFDDEDTRKQSPLNTSMSTELNKSSCVAVRPARAITVPNIRKPSLALSPPSFIHSPRVKNTVNLAIIEDYSNAEVRVQPLVASTQRSMPNRQSSSVPKTQPKAMSYINDYLGASWSLLKDSILQ